MTVSWFFLLLIKQIRAAIDHWNIKLCFSLRMLFPGDSRLLWIWTKPPTSMAKVDPSIKCQIWEMNVCGVTPSLLQTISSVTPAWMHQNGPTDPEAPTHALIAPQLWPLTYMGQQGAGETMTPNYPLARPQLHPDTQGAHPSRRDKERAPLRQTAAGPYGGVPRWRSGITVTHQVTLWHRTYSMYHTGYRKSCWQQNSVFWIT